MIKLGKKTKAWDKARKELKIEFEQKGITTCELRFDGCWVSNWLSFAHIDKRNNLAPDELYSVVLACVPCHQVVERWPRLKMREYLENIIKNR